jgi:hypothetical protein
MTSTDKALGIIGALHTLIRNFPMSILDMSKGKVYTSAFDFIMDVLYACGVDPSEITEHLLKEIYSINIKIEDLYDNVENNLLTDDLLTEQSPFLQTIEEAMKSILMGLLSSVFTCSAIPIIPNKYMDRPKTNSFGVTGNKLSLWETGRYPQTLNIPISYIDPMGILEITPTTSEGRLYYMVEGRDIYYKKVEDETQTISTFSRLRELNTENISVYLTLNTDNNIVFNIDSPVYQDIDISVGYIAYDDNNLCTWETKILAGEIESQKILKLQPVKDNSKCSEIKWIKINESESFKTFDGNWVYLDKEKSENVVNLWNHKNAQSFEKYVKWGSAYVSEQTILGANTETKFKYVECGYSKDVKNAIRVTTKPNNATKNDPDYVVYYEGIIPTNLYKTMDMNAFLWYCIRKGTIIPNIEKNHMMWDSRLSAKKRGITRVGDEEWNEWYNSKIDLDDEFTYKGKAIKKEDALYPILQFEVDNSNYCFNLTFPSQRYFKPKLRESIINGDTNNPDFNVSFNASIYRFNKEYLESIQILRPKLMLVGLCNYLLGFTMSEVMSTRISLTRKMIEAKLSTAVKKIIEADDMEIEDCYMTFSNEEFDEMMRDMLLSRYDSTYYGGETVTIKNHDINDYINRINSISDNVGRAGNIEVITKLITDITAGPSNEASIDYGLQISTDGNLLKKLLWAITMPIIESMFTPQVMLLILMNYAMTGMVALHNLNTIFNFLLNKILGLLKSIILYIKDKIIELLLKFFYQKVLPLLVKYTLVLMKERNTAWLEILSIALSCLPKISLPKRTGIKWAIDNVEYADIIDRNNSGRNGGTSNRTYTIEVIDEVDYADIDKSQNTPENSSDC